MNIIITITVTALVVLYAGLFKAKKALLPLTLLGLLVSLAFVVTAWDTNQTYYGMMQMDNFALAFTGLTIAGTFLIFLLTQNYFAANSENIAEYFTLILFALAGIVIMVSYKNMSMLFIGLEIMSVSLYILAGIRKSNFASNEASLKYFLMGAFSTGFLLFGITLIYGATGSFDLDTINQYLVGNYKAISPMFYPGVILLMIGLCFKIGAAPFHFWTPDVYEGAPTLITTFMSTIVKTAGFAAFLRLFAGTLAPLHDFWLPPLMGIVCLTLLIGNVTALFQKNFKRMLAYSSISHAGYLLFSLVTLTANSSGNVFVYATAYTFATIVAFAVLILVKQKTGNDNFESFNGLAKRNPLTALMLTVAMLSLAGIPLTAGFIGKYLMFVNVMTEYQVYLVAFAILNALVGFYYYFKVIVAMYFRDGHETQLQTPFQYQVVLILSALITLFLGIYPSVILNLI
ncbi:NADH-quinone oxidoreductase subunit N [Pedobacter heparinus]|uniref:NADH-quinone oxidoreductase subunit N n=1 Tax=Pedobacter heparinus (strain ATCC 13125 / DSM 2366 / CIP 104194 / JCM 7457 / NBRC 12017 / NCIMB 9290 / NRRL B-14731 / HIM 762-3) TaxID=485917 RepID=C6XWH1_PEDHD|nr:NADH-quinone oxidoreductase subunit N [Pedobacter heparinus]ACU06260.1 proton-translocating NADH-quinone oxidoreductase, chain N [Pedobacter heparinus DSM 2366]